MKFSLSKFNLKKISFLSVLFSSSVLYAQITPLKESVSNSSTNAAKYVDLSKLVGETKGDLRATPTGGATYAIPIFVSPGTNGLQPSISLIYNSQSSEGIAGLSWNLSGLSMISRAGKNFYHNGKVEPVTYTATDMFLLDGVKLNAISGNNAANGTIYAQENENFSRIISNSTTSTDNPDWFKVTNNDGTIMEYGNSADAKFFTNNGLKTMYWKLNKIIDVNGNFIEYKYETIGRESRLKQIVYTGNANTGLLPYNFIDFIYDSKSESNTTYESGASVGSNALLKSINRSRRLATPFLVVLKKRVHV